MRSHRLGHHYDRSDGVMGLELLSLALCKHYQLEIRLDFDLPYFTQLQHDYQQFGGGVLDKNIYMILNRHVEGGLYSLYGRELLDMWKRGVY